MRKISATELIESELWSEIIDTVEFEILSDWIATESTASQLRESLYAKVHALKDLEWRVRVMAAAEKESSTDHGTASIPHKN